MRIWERYRCPLHPPRKAKPRGFGSIPLLHPEIKIPNRCFLFFQKGSRIRGLSPFTAGSTPILIALSYLTPLSCRARDCKILFSSRCFTGMFSLCCNFSYTCNLRRDRLLEWFVAFFLVNPALFPLFSSVAGLERSVPLFPSRGPEFVMDIGCVLETPSLSPWRSGLCPLCARDRFFLLF